ncbi:MAG: helix-turn-helix domain-containing protein [Empedobacter falsenii]
MIKRLPLIQKRVNLSVFMPIIKRFLFCFFLTSIYIVSGQNSEKDYTIKEITAYYDKINKEDNEASNIEFIKKLITQSKKINYIPGQIRGFISLQRVAFFNNDYVQSGKYSEEVETLALQTGDYYSLSLTYTLRGTINSILDKFTEAEADLDKAIEYGKKIPNLADRHMQLSRIYANKAGMSEGLNNNNKIIENIKKSLELIETIPVTHLSSSQKETYYYLYITTLTNVSAVYLHAYNPPNSKLAEPYIKKALSFERITPYYFKANETGVYFSASDFYTKKGDYQQAINYAIKLLNTKEVKNSPRERMLAYKVTKDAYGAAKDIKNENTYLKLYVNLRDSINAAEKKTIVQQSRNQIKKSAKENNKNTQKILLIVSIIVLLILIVTWVYISKKKQDYHKKYEALIVKIKNEKKISTFLEINDIDTQSIKSSTVNITDKTIKVLLQKLEKFEQSEKYLQKDISLTVLANTFHTNTKYLSEIIKTYRNKNFTDYINGLRINYIVHKLYNEQKYRQYKISSLAEECGFSSPKVFVNAFKKINDVTPSYFIEQLKQDEKN